MIFGHQHNAGKPDASSPAVPANTPTDQPASGVNPLAADPVTGLPLPVTEQDVPHQLDASAPSVLNQSGTSSFAGDPAPASPFGSGQDAGPASQVPDSAAGGPAPSPTSGTAAASGPNPDPQPAPSFSDYVATASAHAPDTAAAPSPAGDGLLDIKQQALGQLGPLVQQLDQTPEEKFRTTMMLVQSTDNSALLKDAYDAAQAITDEKVRAQALLDVINEINYFTQQAGSQTAPVPAASDQTI